TQRSTPQVPALSLHDALPISDLHENHLRNSQALKISLYLVLLFATTSYLKITPVIFINFICFCCYIFFMICLFKIRSFWTIKIPTVATISWISWFSWVSSIKPTSFSFVVLRSSWNNDCPYNIERNHKTSTCKY